jgi:hypothetical protein
MVSLLLGANASVHELATQPPSAADAGRGYLARTVAGDSRSRDRIAVTRESATSRRLSRVVGNLHVSTPIIPGGASIANAVYNACGARVTALPLISESVLAAIDDQRYWVP